MVSGEWSVVSVDQASTIKYQAFQVFRNHKISKSQNQKWLIVNEQQNGW